MPNNKLLSLLVVLILITNVFLISKIGDLNNRVQNLSHNYNSLQSSIHGVTSNVNQSLDRFTREQSWITPIEINHGKSKVDTEQGLVVLNWQIKDHQEGSEVIFHYRQSDSEEFKAVPAESFSAGFFEVTLPLDIQAEPSWELNLSWAGEKPEQVTEQVTEKVAKQEGQQTLRCYVSTKTADGTIKSSEQSYLHVGYLANMKYQPVRGHVGINRNHYNISLFGEYDEYNFNNNTFESFAVEFYNGDVLVTRKPVEVQVDQTGMKHYLLSYDSGSQDITHFILEVKYMNGDTFRKEYFK